MADNYTRIKEFRTRLRGKDITYFSKPGLPNWDEISPATLLLADQVELPVSGKVLVLGCGHGALAASLAAAHTGLEFWLLDHHFIAMQMSAQTLETNRIQNARLHPDISAAPEGAGSFDAAILELPKGRRLAQRWLAEAYTALRPDGQLYLAGANKDGVRPVIRDAEAVFGTASVLGYKKGNRLVRLVKDSAATQEAGWVSAPGIAPGTWEQVEVKTPQGLFQLYSLPGIFSHDRLDPGTRLLLDHLTISPNEAVLDLGCGYGIIGLAAAISGAGTLDLVDTNLLAVAAARKNLEKYDITQAQVHASDVLSAVQGRRYEAIFSNPPFHAGRDVDYQIATAFIQQSQDALKKGGRLTLVANQFIRYERLLEQFFRQVRCLGEDGRYQVWHAIK
jgi:16S rRNA (guanine1207-N2)-methyltransferase